ncbi:hypothetical protein [Streptomyces sp. AHA2]|uniref:hypothetical protein n=1 Tax=Streptomyces sp. AHA2 TaxID=3064526 RepID=UPI002FE37241
MTAVRTTPADRPRPGPRERRSRARRGVPVEGLPRFPAEEDIVVADEWDAVTAEPRARPRDEP